MNLSLYKLIGHGYENGFFTNFKGRYRLYKGARNTKKSYVMIGFEVIAKILDNPLRNVLILRNTLASHRFSTFSTLCKIIENPDINNFDISLSAYFKISKTDLTITYLPTGQVILFKGMDDPQKIQSIRVSKGYLTDVYIEEAFELKDYGEWRKIDGSIRGALPKGLFYQITFCFNAWNINHWIYDKFFKGRLEDDTEYLLNHDYKDYKDENYIGDYGKGLYLHISTYKINEFRTEEYDTAMEELRIKAPEIYKVEALGMWGNSTEATYPEMNNSLIITHQEVMRKRYIRYCVGIDTGLSDGQGHVKGRFKSATTAQVIGLTDDYKELVCVDEYFWTNENKEVPKTEPQLMTEIIEWLIKLKEEVYAEHMDLFKGTIYCYIDSADIGFRQGLQLEARRLGLINVVFYPSTKIKIQSRVDFIRLIMAMGEYLISNKCVNLIREIKNSRHGEKGEARENFDDHAINANEYAWYPVSKMIVRWKTFKEH